MDELSIAWKEEKDRHILGVSPLGKVMIRLDRDRKVTGMYTLFKTVEKWMPSDEHEEEILGAQLRLQEIINQQIQTNRLQRLLRSN